MNYNSNINLNKNYTKNKLNTINQVLSNKVKNYKFNQLTTTSKSKYMNEKEYEKSFNNDIIKFEKTIKDIEKKKINVIIYHADNNDGVLAAYICWKYLKKDNKLSNIKFYGLKPGKSNVIDKSIENILYDLKDKYVLITDLAYNQQTLKALSNTVSKLIIIDDHPDLTIQGKTYFAGENHSASAYIWKFFYPEEKVPKMVQYIDDSDAKLFLPFTPNSNYVALSIGFRYVHNIFKLQGDKLFEILDDVLKNDNPNFFIFIGKYYDEVRENIKSQIAINARMINFQGYRVGVLNFNAPSLTKPVGRQIITNMKKRGENIDFAVLWGYEYSLNPPGYSVTIIDDHKQTKINLKELVNKLASKGGHPKGGYGHEHDGHFYWSKNIMELFN